MTPTELKEKYKAVPPALLGFDRWIGAGQNKLKPKAPDIPAGRKYEEGNIPVASLADVCAKAEMRGYSGAGIALTDRGGIIAMDLDKVLDTKTGELLPQLQHREAIENILKAATDAGAYIEVSNSGRGLHIIGAGFLDEALNHSAKAEWEQAIETDEAERRGIEVYDFAKFILLTGRPWQGFLGGFVDVTEVSEVALQGVDTIKRTKDTGSAGNTGSVTGAKVVSENVFTSGIADYCIVSGGKVTATGGFISRLKGLNLNDAAADADHNRKDNNIRSRIERSAKSGDKFKALWRGDISAGGGGHSEADEALLAMLCWFCAPAPETQPDYYQVARLWRKSGLWRGNEDTKHNNADYVPRSIANAAALWIYNTRALNRPQYNPQEWAAKNAKATLQQISAKTKEANKWFEDNFAEKQTELFNATIYSLTESGAAERAEAVLGSHIRYELETRKWLVYSDSRGLWEYCEAERIKGLIDTLFKKMEVQAFIMGVNGDDLGGVKAEDFAIFANKQRTLSKLNAITELLKTKSGVQISASAFNQKPNTLNTLGGEMDLISGEVWPHRKESYFTKQTAAALPIAYSKDNVFRQTVEQIIPDSKTREYIQVALGSVFDTEQRQKPLLWCFGAGGSGKGTLFNGIQAALGSYAGTIDKEMLLTSRNDAGSGRPNPAVLELNGLLIGFCSETEQGRKLNQAQAKNITGGDELKARTLYSANYVSFRSHALLLVQSQYAPDIYNIYDSGLRRRFRAVPFNQSFAGDNRVIGLDTRFSSEPAIINDCLLWLYEGYQKYIERGRVVDGGLDSKKYPLPPEVMKTTMGVYEESDLCKWFIENYCTTGEGLTADRTQLWRSYREAAGEGFKKGAQKKFYDELKAKGYEFKRYAGKYRVYGLSLIEDDFTQDLATPF